MSKHLAEARVRAGLFGTVVTIGMLASGWAWAVDTPPRVDMTQPRPQEYPDSAQVSGEQGSVLVSVYVRPNGKVAKYRIAQSSGFPDLDTAALESVLNWRFVPATHDGDTVSDWTTVRIVYQLPVAPAQPAALPPG